MQIFFVLSVRISSLKGGSPGQWLLSKRDHGLSGNKKLNYINAAKFTLTVQRITGRSDFWLNLNDGIERRFMFLISGNIVTFAE
ncbi:MAG: hypothetical protein LBH60_04495 [Prevotellaceae bacterium]|jgi:hypothetical protein|nr:hypothetical protein [Prevotellaceae bacterium]